MIVRSRMFTTAPSIRRAAVLVFLGTAMSSRSLQATRPAVIHSPREWAVIASENEVRAITHSTSLLRYQVRTVDQKGERTREVLECDGGSVARTIERNGKPLTPEETTAERDRLQQLLDSPSEFARHMRNDSSEKKMAVDLVRLMPDAMIYSPVTGEVSTHAPDGSPLVVFDFSPNPAWNPPTTASQALTGLRGRMWINEQSGYVARMDGEIFRPVNFGYGMVAHIYPGGHLSLTQVNVGGDRWLYSHFEEHIRIRALMFKTIDVDTTIDSSNYKPVPGPLSWQQAIQLLLQ